MGTLTSASLLRFGAVGVVGEILAWVGGIVIVVGTLRSAMLTVVVPRAERPIISAVHFWVIGAVASLVIKGISDPERRDRREARMAPFGLVSLPFVWAFHVTLGFSLIFWAQGTRPWIDAFVLSGSSLTTLGFRSSDDVITLLLTIFEALIGLGLVALMISYLPTIYGAYTDREVAVARLEVRAGRPPSPITFLERSHRIGWLGQMDVVWSEWEEWFLRIEETHTTHSSLPLFRSAQSGRSWLTAAATVLDSAAIIVSAIDGTTSPRASLCLRSGFTTLRSIADVRGIPYPTDPAPDDPISVTRASFDALLDELANDGIALKEDRDQAWRDFAGWRVNYDAALNGLLAALRIDSHDWFVGTSPIE